MVGEINTAVTVGDDHFEYLRIQKGSLDKFAHDRERWHAMYEADLARTFEEIRPFLPPVCWGFIDIGAGLGGIDVLIRRHYEAADGGVFGAEHGCPYVHLLDGIDDPPVMNLHRQTFSNRAVARDFQLKNGLPAERFRYFGPGEPLQSKPFDLVVSFGSWCFHYPPAVYLPELMRGGGVQKDCVVIVDLRRGRGWDRQLWDAGLRALAIVRDSEKFLRVVLVKE